LKNKLENIWNETKESLLLHPLWLRSQRVKARKKEAVFDRLEKEERKK